MKFFDIDQNSPEWFQLRVGKFTMSSAKTLFSKKTTDTYKKFVSEKAYERITGKRNETPTTFWMDRGHEYERIARKAYMNSEMVWVDDGGFFCNDIIGASPDGLVGEDGLLEIKCPSIPVHYKYLKDQKLPTIYKEQVLGQLYVTDRDWCDFYSYHPDVKQFLIRVYRDREWEKVFETKIAEAEIDVLEAIKILK